MFANDLAENMIKASSISKNLFLKHIGDELFYNIGDNKSKPIIEIVKLIAHLMKFKGKNCKTQVILTELLIKQCPVGKLLKL